MPKAAMAMSADFLTAFARLPRHQQRGVRTLITRFTADATASGLNYEHIRGAADPKMRSLRIDQGYRAIVLKPERGNVHMLLWADKHDDAYQWAARHCCDINPETGALQVYAPQTQQGTAPQAAPIPPPTREGENLQSGGAGEYPPQMESGAKQHHSPETQGVGQHSFHADAAFKNLKDRQLIRLGVPPAMLPEVRDVPGEAELDAMQSRLPGEAYDALFLYLAGESYEALVLEREVPEAVDVEDFPAALERADSRMRFVVAEDDIALEAMLNAPLERWRVFLHPSQRRLVERHWNGPVRVLGGAGTGKTVVAMHRARWLAQNLPKGRILFTTFTRNLAADIEGNLRTICSPQEMDRIDVTNLDRWVMHFLRGRRYEFRIQYGRHPEGWQRALDLKPPELNLPDAFYADEWEQVVQANAINSEPAYRRVSRVGRGVRLSRAMRVKIWPVFEEYRAQLAERGAKEVDDAYRDAAALLREGAPVAGDAVVPSIPGQASDSFPGAPSESVALSAAGYASVIVDEAQDMGTQAFALLRAIVPAGRDNMFITGDGHQRIYGRRVVLGRCGIDIRGRARKLRLNYRTTEETRQWAARLLAGRSIDDLDGGVDDNRGIKSLTRGPKPILKHFDSREEQNADLVHYLKGLPEGESLRNVCVVARTGGERDAAVEALRAAGLQAVVIGRGTTDDLALGEGARLATMHRVKGLEFDRVIMVSVNDGLVPHHSVIATDGGHAPSDAVAREAAETGERALLYVAATRAKKELLLFCFGTPSGFLSEG